VATRDDQFSQALLRRATDERVVGENLDRLCDQIYRFNGDRGFSIDQEFDEPFQIRQSLARIN
jgi:hypothetical protein